MGRNGSGFPDNGRFMGRCREGRAVSADAPRRLLILAAAPVIGYRAADFTGLVLGFHGLTVANG